MTDNETPDLTAERAALATARLRHEAAAALHAAGCSAIELFTPHVEALLRISPDTGDVAVLDEDGTARHRVSPSMLAREMRAEWVKKTGERFFK